MSEIDAIRKAKRRGDRATYRALKGTAPVNEPETEQEQEAEPEEETAAETAEEETAEVGTTEGEPLPAA